MIKIFPVVEFYITNVCNLSCRGCNRFNNYKFKGHQRWNDHAVEYEKWSKRLDLPRITIMGGEPTLNPDLEKYASNLRKLWPDAVIMVQTNGTYQRPAHLEFFHEHMYRVGFGLSLHDPATADELKKKWEHHAGPIDAYTFHQSAVIEQDGKFTLHNSNPKEAFSVCDMKHDHTMYNGKLYKCPFMAVIPDFDKQFNLDLTEEQRELLYSFKPLSADCSDEELQDFVDSKDKHIPQCQFCPQHLKWHTALGEFKDNLPKPEFAEPVKEHEIVIHRKGNPLYL